jgi:hypothetical protein
MVEHPLSQSSYSHVIDVPADRVDIADWLFHLGNAEYERCCPPDHLACGYTQTDDGQPMSINVETIGQSLVVQQYTAEVHEPQLCRMVSTSDVFPFSGGLTTSKVVWTLSVEPIDESSCRYTNSVTAFATDDFLKFIEEHGQTFEQAAAARQETSSDHNRRETPLFAESIARAARARQSAKA